MEDDQKLRMMTRKLRKMMEDDQKLPEDDANLFLHLLLPEEGFLSCETKACPTPGRHLL